MRSRSITSVFASVVGVAVVTIGAVACEDVAGLGLTYRSKPALSDAGEGGASAEASSFPCPCDESEGLGCCISGGVSYCAFGDGTCGASGPALYLGCQRPDSLSESVCCWSPDGEGSMVAAYAADCGARAMACVDDSDCAGQTCNHLVCAGVTLGVCGSAAMPACP